MEREKILCLVLLFSILTGVPCVYYGSRCKSPELRAHNNTELCKNIHNDESAMALIVFGWILSIPWLTALVLCLFVVPCYGLYTQSANESGLT